MPNDDIRTLPKYKRLVGIFHEALAAGDDSLHLCRQAALAALKTQGVSARTANDVVDAAILDAEEEATERLAASSSPPPTNFRIRGLPSNGASQGRLREDPPTWRLDWKS